MAAEFRYREIDSLRGLAVLLMVMVHAAAIWSPKLSTETSSLSYIVAGLGGLAAPLFVTIFGWGLIKSRSNNRSSIIKAMILLILQILVNLSSPQLYQPLSPGILSLFAVLIILKPLIIKITTSRTIFLLFWLFILLFYAVNNMLFNIQGENNWDFRTNNENLSMVISHLILTGTYPILPWICYAVVGAFLGSSITEGGKTLPRNSTTLLIMIGMCYCLFTLIRSTVDGSIWAHPTQGGELNFFPVNTGFIIASMTGVFIFWLIIQEFKITIFEGCGKLSLTIYVVHFIPLSIMSNLENEKDWTVMEASQAVVLFTTTWLIFAYVWNRYQWLTIEYLIRKLSRR